MRPLKVGLVAVVTAVLALGFTAAPALASPPTSITMVGTPYNNVFLWFGVNNFADNVPFGTWSNCPYGSTLTSTSLCSSTALTNADWDSNNVGYTGNCDPSSGYSDWCLTLSGNELTISQFVFVDPLFCSVGLNCFSPSYFPTATGSVTFHRDGNSGMWKANPLKNEVSSTLSSAACADQALTALCNGTPYAINYMGGTLVFDGTPSASTFVSGNITQWSYITPLAYNTFQSACVSHSGTSCLPDAVYVPSQKAYLILTSIDSLSSTSLSPAQLNQLILSTGYLNTQPS